MNSSNQLEISSSVAPDDNLADVSTPDLPRRKAANVDKAAKIVKETTALLHSPWRIVPLVGKVVSDAVRIRFEHRHLYSYTKTRRESGSILSLLLRWILQAQQPDGGIAAYYSLLAGYSASYPEVTGYIVPTLYDYAQQVSDGRLGRETIAAAERATDWLLFLQIPNGAFPAGLHGATAEASIFNTGQILQGLIRAHAETNRHEILRGSILAADYLIRMQQPDGSWSGTGAYQGSAHTYYSMVAWPLALLSLETADPLYARAAETNLDWVLSQFQPNGWINGMNLHGHPNYLHFIAYALQGALECGVLLQRNDAVEAVANSAWICLRRFEANKFLCGAYDGSFNNGRRFICLTGNAQMSCVWLRLFEITGELRYLNAALKMNEMLKQLISTRGAQGIAGGVSGSYPVWGRYQPLRYISWGCKFFADALLLEQRIKRSIESSAVEALPCAS
ncbi:MAG: prenyltransferase/squalene oxidase repeat-containing protein [Candidatus Sulfotelmatobacter sp.]